MKQWITVFKWVWIVLILSFISWYIYSHTHILGKLLREVPLKTVLFSAALILVGKTLLGFNVYLSLKMVGVKISKIKCLQIYNLTQLAKYLPGSIWQFIGKISLYRNEGMNPGTIKQAILLEIIWTLFGAFFFGFFSLFIFNYRLFTHFFILFTSYLFYIMAFVAVAVVIMYFYIKPKYNLFNRNKRTSLALILIQVSVWASMGISFLLIVGVFSEHSIHIIPLIGLFPAAFFLGFITPFAPAGLGIREGVIIFGLSGILDTEIAILVSGLHRALYLGIEILLFLVFIKPFLSIKKDSKGPGGFME